MKTMGVAIDFVGYETLVDFINKNELYLLSGDFMEIGAFVGGGTQKLAQLASVHSKKVIVVDIFNPEADATATPSGIKMSDIYLSFLEGRSQYQEFCNNTKNYDNIVTFIQDSKQVTLDPSQKFAFGFIDGNHNPEYVKNDFLLVWNRLVAGGAVALHDYRTELPEVTRTIDTLLDEKKTEIAYTVEIPEKHILIVLKQ
jgi:hypothetical protein